MGLTMSEKKAITRETAVRYRKSDRANKQKILDEFTETTGYNRKYAIHLLNRWGTEQIQRIDGELIRFVVGTPKKRRKRISPRIYDTAVKQALTRIWELFDYMCGKRLAVFLRLNIDMLSLDAELAIDPEVKEKLIRISPATIDRLLCSERKKLTIKGRSHTRAGTLLKHQIPIRVYYGWDERTPGFFELDTVAHDGGTSSGEYCWTLTATDVYSGWVEVRALKNRAHRWVKAEFEGIYEQLPFPLKGIDSDNGSEFINTQLFNWCTEQKIQFTRSRAYHKNDNCFVEQKNDLVVRRTVGYYRFDTAAEYQALQEVYRHLCPLVNFYYPSARIIEKVRTGAKVKKVYDSPKPPYIRLLESPDITPECKMQLRERAKKFQVVKQKRKVEKAIATLMHLRERKLQQRLPFE